MLGCDCGDSKGGTCGSRVGLKVYRDKATNASFRACWRPSHRQQARLALQRQVAKLKNPRRR